MKELEEQLDLLESKIPEYELLNTSISTSNIGWHIEHSLLVISGIIETTANSNPKDYQWAFNWRQILVFIQGKIPRGKARAPKAVQPQINYTIESLTEHVTSTRAKLEKLKQLDKDKYFKHPGLGNLNLKQTIKFLEIHTNHHLKIINEIDVSEEEDKR
ncbi:MAG: DinB family protein [Bacteroidota bacterium]